MLGLGSKEQVTLGDLPDKAGSRISLKILHYCKKRAFSAQVYL